MRRLTDADRAKIVRLRFDEGLSTAAISERLGWSQATIRNVVLAEKKLRAVFIPTFLGKGRWAALVCDGGTHTPRKERADTFLTVFLHNPHRHAKFHMYRGDKYGLRRHRGENP